MNLGLVELFQQIVLVGRNQFRLPAMRRGIVNVFIRLGDRLPSNMRLFL